MNTEQRLAALEREVADLRRLKERVQVVPWNNPRAQVTTLLVNGGNTLYTSGATTIYGIKSVASYGVPVIPTAAPIGGTTYPDGLGYGSLLDANGNPTGSYVWIVNQPANSGEVGSVANCVLVASSIVASLVMRTYDLGGGNYAPYYLAWRV